MRESRYFSEIQAVMGEQSVLTSHSGLQLGGIPTCFIINNPALQVETTGR